MKKIVLNLAVLLMLFSGQINAGEIRFTAAAKSAVRVGEQFQLTFQINAEGTGFRGPSIKDFKVITGPNHSSSSSVQIIKGKVSRETSYTFTYILSAVKEGVFTILPATINYKGKQYKSNSLKINVVKGIKQDDVYIKTVVNKTNPYQGEQIILTIKFYTCVQIKGINQNKISSFPGFWSKNIRENEKTYPQKQKHINGKEYIVAEIGKFALFPQKSGEITIEPAEVNCVAQIRTSSQRRSSDPFFDSFFNDPFFSSGYKNVDKQLFSNSVKINVKPLPLKNKPKDFSGAVGTFTFNSKIDRTEIKTNEAINLKFTLKGRGNIQLIDPPNVTFPPDFEVYDPETKSNIKINGSGVSGTRTFEYLVIPRNPGDYSIKPVKFTYFDISKKEYVPIITPEYKINVDKGEGAFQNITYSGVSQEDIKYIGKDIRHIKLMPFEIRSIGVFFFRSDVFYILLISPVVIFILIIIIWKNRVKRRSNVAFMKNKKATKVSRKRLKTAHNFMKTGDENNFYVEISGALWGYIIDKFNIPKADLSIDTVKDALLKKNCDENIINQFSDTLNNCEYVRFAPGDKSENMGKIYNEALEIISKTERELR